MMVIRLSLASGLVLKLADVVHGQHVHVTTRGRSRHTWILMVHDTRLTLGTLQSHEWVDAYDNKGRLVRLHVDPLMRIERMSIFERRHPAAPVQLALFSAA